MLVFSPVAVLNMLRFLIQVEALLASHMLAIHVLARLRLPIMPVIVVSDLCAGTALKRGSEEEDKRRIRTGNP